MPKLSSYPVITTFNASDLIPITHSGATNNITTQNLLPDITGLQASIVTLQETLTGVVSTEAYGVVADGITDDRLALQAAATAAGVGGHLLLPAGTVRVTMSGVTAITIPANQTWWGRGKSTVIYGDGPTVNSPLTAGGTLLYAAPNTSLTLRNMIVRGPTDLGGFSANLVLQGGGDDTNRLILDGVRLEGNSGAAVKVDAPYAGNGNDSRTFVKITNGEWDIDSGMGISYGGITGAKCHVYNSDFFRYGTSGSNQLHAIDCLTSVSVDVAHTRFWTSNGTGFAITYSSVNGTPYYWIIRDCYLGDGVQAGFLTNPNVRVRISGLDTGLVKGNVIELSSNVGSSEIDIEDCNFLQTAAIPIITFGASVVKARFRRCYFARTTAPFFITGDVGTQIIAEDCSFNFASTTTPFSFSTTRTSITTRLNNNRYTNTTIPGQGTTAQRPSAVDSGPGAGYYDTTLGQQVYSNGTVWA